MVYLYDVSIIDFPETMDLNEEMKLYDVSIFQLLKLVYKAGIVVSGENNDTMLYNHFHLMPFVTKETFNGGTFDFGLLWKLCNNGQTYLLSPVRLNWLDDRQIFI